MPSLPTSSFASAILPGRLYLGSYADACNIAALRQHRIRHIINVTTECEPPNDLTTTARAVREEEGTLKGMERKEPSLREATTSNGSQIPTTTTKSPHEGTTSSSSSSMVGEKVHTEVSERSSSAAEFEVLRIPIDDRSDAPMVEYLEGACAYIAAALDRGDAVLVHCRMGLSRSATVVLAFLMAHGAAFGLPTTTSSPMHPVHHFPFREDSNVRGGEMPHDSKHLERCNEREESPFEGRDVSTTSPSMETLTSSPLDHDASAKKTGEGGSRGKSPFENLSMWKPTTLLSASASTSPPRRYAMRTLERAPWNPSPVGVETAVSYHAALRYVKQRRPQVALNIGFVDTLYLWGGGMATDIDDGGSCSLASVDSPPNDPLIGGASSVVILRNISRP